MLHAPVSGASGEPQGTVPRVHISQLCPSAPSCKIRSLWLRPSAGPSSSSLATREPPLRSRDLLSITGMNLKAWFQMFFCFSTEQLFFLKSSLSQMAVGGSNTSLIVAPWINGGSWKHDSLGGVPSLLMPTSKFKFPVKKKCPLNSRPES